MANINTDPILARLNAGEDFTIPGISKKNLAYIRCWANRKGFFVALVDGGAVVSKENRKRLRTELYEWMAKGNDFSTDIHPGQIQYLRNLVSEYNKANPAGPRWHAAQELTFPEKKPVVKDDGNFGFIIFTDPK